MSTNTVAGWDNDILEINFAQWIILHLAFATVALYVSAVIQLYWSPAI